MQVELSRKCGSLTTHPHQAVGQQAPGSMYQVSRISIPTSAGSTNVGLGCIGPASGRIFPSTAKSMISVYSWGWRSPCCPATEGGLGYGISCISVASSTGATGVVALLNPRSKDRKRWTISRGSLEVCRIGWPFQRWPCGTHKA